MPYVPNPQDPTNPLDSVDASTAAAEFRALKTYLSGLVLAAGKFTGRRQCALDGVKDTSGNPAFIIAAGGGGLAIDVKATATPLFVNFAGGLNAGFNDRIDSIAADIPNAVAGLPANNRSFIYAIYNSAGNWTWGSTLVPIHYGNTFKQDNQALLHFEGANGSTSFIDDYGNTWTANGGAKLQNTQVKIGTTALGGSGGAAQLNGTTDSATCANFSFDTREGWTIEGYIQATALPGAGAFESLAYIANSAGFGAGIGIGNIGGVIKFTYYLSADGATFSIANGVQGTTTPVINTWYHIALTYDFVVGVYRLYVNGQQESSTASTSRISECTTAGIGVRSGLNTAFLAGYVDEVRISRYCRYPNGTAFIPYTVAQTVEGDWFDTQGYNLYSVTAASAVAGQNPTLTKSYKCYLGEVDTSAIAVIAARSYAFNGQQIVDSATMVVTTLQTMQHLLGVTPRSVRTTFVNVKAEAGYTQFEEIQLLPNYFDGTNSRSYEHNVDRINFYIHVNSGAPVLFTKLAAGAAIAMTLANWKVRAYLDRGF